MEKDIKTQADAIEVIKALVKAVEQLQQRVTQLGDK